MAGLLLATSLLILAIGVVGCADKQQRYQVLSFFFDGVPDPNAPQKQVKRVTRTGRQTFVHKPYADNLCNSCHLNTSDIFARAKVREDVCLDCHSNVPTQYPVMHGPVVNNACRMCHSAHSSAVPHLLKKPSLDVCTQCHEPETMQLMHKRPLDPKASCIDCHSGHGGTNHSLLLAMPATRPAILGESEVPR